MSALTDFRNKLIDELAKDMAPLEFVPQILTGPNENRDIGSVWIDSLTRDGMAQGIIVGVQIFKQWTFEEPFGKDPTELEQVSDDLFAALKDIQAVPSPGIWMFDFNGVVISQETWSVQAELLARRENPFVP